MARPGREPTTYRMRGGQANHYKPPDAVCLGYKPQKHIVRIFSVWDFGTVYITKSNLKTQIHLWYINGQFEGLCVIQLRLFHFFTFVLPVRTF